MYIRKANILDLSVLVKHGEKFMKFLCPEKRVDQGHLCMVLENLISNHVVFVAEHNGEFYGSIGGILTENLWYPEEKELQELFWWVSPDHRGSTAGLRLLKHWIEHGKELGINVAVCRESISPLSEDALTKRGFDFKSQTFLMEV